MNGKSLQMNTGRLLVWQRNTALLPTITTPLPIWDSEDIIQAKGDRSEALEYFRKAREATRRMIIY